MAPDVRAAICARLLVRSVLPEWGLSELVDDVTVCASELTGNAVRHARREIVARVPERLMISLRLAGVAPERSLWFGVRDGDPTLPVLRPRLDLDALDLDELADVTKLAESGAGLHLVGELSDELGWYHVPGGKLVWCRFTIK